MNMASLRIAVSLLLLASACGQCAARNPGISLRLSEQFFSYVLHQVVSPAILHELNSSNIQVPDVTEHVSGLNFDIFLTDIVIEPSSYVLHPDSIIMPNGNLTALEFKLGIYIDLVGKWKSRARWWPYITESGTTRYYTEPLWIDASINMTPGADGLWNFTLVDFGLDCNLHVKFSGDGVSGLDVGALAKDLDEKATAGANSALRPALENILANLTPIMKRYLPYVSYKNCTRFGIPDCQDFALNLSLSSSGVWKQNCSAEIQLNGYLLYKRQAFLPTPAEPFPAVTGCGDHSVSLLLSGGTFSSVVAAILASGLVHGNFPTDKFANDSYYDQYVPGLKKYGDLPLYANLTLLNSSMTIDGKEMRVQFGAMFNVLVDKTPAAILPEKEFEEAFEMIVTTTVGLRAWLENITTPDGMMSLLFMNFTTSSIDGITLHNSSVGPVAVDKIHVLMQQLLTSGFANADELMTKGILIIPNHVGKISLPSPQLTIGPGYLKLAIDIGMYNTTPMTTLQPPTAVPDLSSEEVRDHRLLLEKIVTMRVNRHEIPDTVTGAVAALSEGLVEAGVMLAKTCQGAFMGFLLGH